MYDNANAGLEIFAGCANLTLECRKLGLPMLDPVDVKYGPCWDILDPAVFQFLVLLQRSGKVS